MAVKEQVFGFIDEIGDQSDTQPPSLTSKPVLVLVGALGNGLEIGGPNGHFEEHIYYV